MTRLCTICARGGSKGIPGKNVRDLGGKPLIAYSIEQALASALFESVAVSSDSNAILEIAGKWGAEHLIKRPELLATDEAAKLPAIRHCVTETESRVGHAFDVIVDLDATAPLRLIGDIRGAVSLLESTQAGNVITGANARKSPYFNLVELNPDGTVVLAKPPAKQFVRRQDAPQCFDMNASIYVWRRDALFAEDAIINSRTRLFIMPDERSVDIDSEFDFAFTEFVMSRGLKRGQGQ